ncbi:lsb5p [Saccharomyces arboricola H-6]|uniref:Lsb5p n=1 Tax=Saccharomyces arboricola (strain H-6 / AS 2.3317 / CBS 10644) TaxID=1160507 RepID=J8Q4A7_SACAR|nr:lsb5p [Saccharomyces arboricola H-6]
MGFLSDHPHTAITETIFRIVSSRDYTLEVELAPLIQLIKADHNDYNYTINQEEAARALRKKIKYGNRLQQSRTLDLLDLFISQGVKFTVMYNDDKLLQRLKGMAMNSESSGSGEKYEARIIKKCAGYVISWMNYITQNELERARAYAGLYQMGQLVKQKYSKSNRSRRGGGRSGGRSNFMDDSADDTLYQSGSLTSADRLYRIPQINLNKEAPKIRLIISDALASAVSLQNSLIGLPRGKYSTDDEEATSKFIQARAIRRKVLRYLQLVTEGEFLGSLIHANDELVAALTSYDERSAQDDASDENDHDSYNDDVYDENEQDNSRYIGGESSSEEESLSSYQPSTTSNPFGDHNQI